jgi:hypothetical protein
MGLLANITWAYNGISEYTLDTLYEVGRMIYTPIYRLETYMRGTEY